MIEFVVMGRAEPAGSKNAFALRRKDGTPVLRENGTQVVSVVDANKNAKPWQKRVKEAARAAYDGPLLEGPLRVSFTFYVQRPKIHYRTGKNKHLLKDSAPDYPTTRPDVLKLSRAVEDALTEVIWNDDAQIVVEHLVKVYGDFARVEIAIQEIESGVVRKAA